MKKIVFGILILISLVSNSQFSLESAKNKAKNVTSSTVKKPLTNNEIIQGLKEALNIGVQKSCAKASKVGGFSKNEYIRIQFPEKAKKMEEKLRLIGMSNQIDDFEAALNKAAEKATGEAAPIFLNVIKSMNLSDGMSILRGSDNAATDYLSKVTSDSLYIAFKPIIEKAIYQVNVTKYWNLLASRYNKIPLTSKINPDLEDYTTKKAIEGIFKLLASEEEKIRNQLSARTSELLKKVFAD